MSVDEDHRLALAGVDGWMRLRVLPLVFAGLSTMYPLIVLLAGGSELAGAITWLVLTPVFLAGPGRAGVHVNSDGLRIRRAFTRRTLRWSEVAGFSARPWRSDVAVYVDTTSGKRLLLPGIFQGREVRWPDGHSRDALTTLQSARRANTQDRSA